MSETIETTNEETTQAPAVNPLMAAAFSGVASERPTFIALKENEDGIIEMDIDKIKLVDEVFDKVEAGVSAPTEQRYFYISKETQDLLRSGTDQKVTSAIESVKIVPGALYAIFDIAGGEKVSGIMAIIGIIPGFAKSKVAEVRGTVDYAKAMASLKRDIADCEKKEIPSLLKEALICTLRAMGDNIGNLKEHKKDVQEAASAIMDVAEVDKNSEGAQITNHVIDRALS